jgi:hypothetical protein
VEERHLGQREELIRNSGPGHDLAVEGGQCPLGILFEAPVQVCPVEDDLGGDAGAAGREDAARQLLVHGARVHLGDADRRGARLGKDQQNGDPGPEGER